MIRFDPVLNLMKSLTILLICSAACTAHDQSSTPEESSNFAVQQTLPLLHASEIASKLYADPDCKLIAFTCGNHATLAPLQQLNSFLLTTASKDIQFRYVLIESPADLKPGFIAASKGEITYNEFISSLDEPWQMMMTKRPQSSYYSTLLKTIQTINVDRPEHPILMIPVDGFTTKRVMFDMNRAREAQINPRQLLSFVDSVNRERETAKNVLNVVKEFPKARGAVFYHQGHILKGLRRELPELDDESHLLLKREVTHSTWVGFAQKTSPGFGEGLRIVVFDEVDRVYNPHGILHSKALGGREYTHLSGSILRGTTASRLDPVKYFQPDSRVRRYHTEKQHFPESIGQILDAFVVIRE